MADKLSPMDGYDDFLRELKERIRSAQVKAALSVNRELKMVGFAVLVVFGLDLETVK